LYNPINGEHVERHKDFYFIGAANTFGKGGTTVYTGRNRLDAATLDRFITISVDYLSEIEDNICTIPEITKWLRNVRKAVETKGSNEVVSYRAFDKAYRLSKSGVSNSRIQEMLFASWPESTRNAIPKIE
jgi:MoxR-like ATPase